MRKPSKDKNKSELEQLRKENKYLRIENEYLKGILYPSEKYDNLKGLTPREFRNQSLTKYNTN